MFFGSRQDNERPVFLAYQKRQPSKPPRDNKEVRRISDAGESRKNNQAGERTGIDCHRLELTQRIF
jgi:hypothetical protein